MEPFPIENRAQLSAEDFAALATVLRGHHSMKHVLDWAAQQSPSMLPGDMITQDEYSHDFLFRLAEDRYLVYDST
jgi:hypothetical protein